VQGFPEVAPHTAGLCSIQGKCILGGMWSPVEADEIGGSVSRPGRRWRGLLVCAREFSMSSREGRGLGTDSGVNAEPADDDSP
jgi:hypothetical protein